MEIKTRVVYNPKLTFDRWAKGMLDLEHENEGYTEVTASATFESKVISMSWKKDPRVKMWEDMVMAAVKAYGGVLEGKHFYFTRRYTDRLDLVDIELKLFVIEG